jgi:hypothetical protein
MDNIAFSIEIATWALQIDGSSLPICKITSPHIIDNAGRDFDAFSSETLDVHPLSGQYVTSFLFWEASRVHADIGNLHILMVNLEDKVGVVLYSKTTKFTVKTAQGVKDEASNKNGVWHSFAVLSNEEMLQVKESNA